MSIPGAASPLFLATTAGAAGGFEISRSIRINDDDTAYFNRTPSSGSNRKTWTWSAWIKRGKISSEACIFTAGSGTANTIRFNGNDTMKVNAGSDGSVETVAVFRDPSAWYSIIVVLDTTQATASDRLKIYVNSVLQAVTGTYPTQNSDGSYNEASVHYLGRQVHNTANLFDGYLAEINFVDGSALDPTSFGETDDNGVWQAIDTAGLTFGTNGFRLKFADNSGATATTLGKDTSANSNNWTPNNLSVAAGAGNDSLVDSPTNGTQTDTGAGGEVVGNYATMNPLDNGGLTLANGNLDVTMSTSAWRNCRATIGMTSGKWYFEVECKAATSGQGLMPGILNAAGSITTTVGANSGGYAYNAAGGNKYNNNVGSSYGAAFDNGDIIGVAYDGDNGTITFYKNGASQGVAFTSIPSGTYFPAVAMTGTMSASINFGSRAFAYTAPSGYKSLNTANLPTPTIADGSQYFEAKLYAGNSGDGLPATQNIATNFSPDMVWVKSRTDGNPHTIFDIVRGAGKRVQPNSSGSETTKTQTLQSFNTDGFTLNGDNSVNDVGHNYVAWAWDAGTSTVTNNDGSIASQVRAQPSAGFSICTYTGTEGGTFGHGLNAAPEFVMVKRRNASADWCGWHIAIPNTQYLMLNESAGVNTFNVWGNTSPTSSVVSVSGDSYTGNNGDTYVAYCFAPVAGYSAMGSYTGNGSDDGPFVFTGHSVAWIMIKRSDAVDNWVIYDVARDTYNIGGRRLYPDLSNAESQNVSHYVDILSNGFKVRSTGGMLNASGGNYIYMSFASNPFASNGGLAR